MLSFSSKSGIYSHFTMLLSLGRRRFKEREREMDEKNQIFGFSYLSGALIQNCR